MYNELQVIDMRILLDVESHAYKDLGGALKKRQTCIRVLQETLSSAMTCLSLEDLELVMRDHETARQRDRVISSSVRGLRDAAREQMMACLSVGARTSAYARTARQRGYVI